jgi:hypothetical protein
MRLIGLSGKMHSGKDTVAGWLVSTHGYVQSRFADAIRAEIIDAGFPPDWVAAKNPECRTLLTAYGAAWRDVDAMRWIEKLLARLNAIASRQPPGIVVSDVRFVEEIEELSVWAAEKSVDFDMLRIERMVYSRRHIVGADDESEVALDHYKFTHVAAARSGRTDLLLRRAAEELGLDPLGPSEK